MAKVISMHGNGATVEKTNATVQAVLQALDAWCEWAPKTTRGVLTPHQLLAVVLWAIQTDTTSPEDEVLIVNGWTRALVNFMPTIPALHPVTLLAIDTPPSEGNWVLSIEHAQEFLDSLPVGFRLEVALEHFRTEAAKQLESGKGGAAYADVVTQRKNAGKGEPWTFEQLELVGEQVKARSVKVVAGELGISRQSLTTALKRSRDQRGPAKRVNAVLR